MKNVHVILLALIIWFVPKLVVAGPLETLLIQDQIRSNQARSEGRINTVEERLAAIQELQIKQEQAEEWAARSLERITRVLEKKTCTLE